MDIPVGMRLMIGLTVVAHKAIKLFNVGGLGDIRDTTNAADQIGLRPSGAGSSVSLGAKDELEGPDASELPLRVLVAGGGVAGLEALYGLHALAGDRVKLTLLAPADEFVYSPLAAEQPFGVRRPRQIPLTRAALHAGAAFVAGTIGSVDPEHKIVTTSDGAELRYDGLLLAVGATPEPVVPDAITWDDRADSETVGGLVDDIEQGYSHSLAVVIPPGPVWPLRGYELALMIALEAYDMSAEHQTTLVTPEPSPLELLGPRAVALVSSELN